MRHANHKSGFSLIEVLVALAIAGIMLVAYLGMQSRLLHTVVQSVHEIQATNVVSNYLAQAQKDRFESSDKSQTQDVTIPIPAKMTYKVVQIADTSSLKRIHNIRIERGEIVWKEGNKERKRQLVQCRYIEPEKKGAA